MTISFTDPYHRNFPLGFAIMSSKTQAAYTSMLNAFRDLFDENFMNVGHPAGTEYNAQLHCFRPRYMMLDAPNPDNNFFFEWWSSVSKLFQYSMVAPRYLGWPYTQVLKQITTWVRYAERQTGNKLCIIQADRGGEFDNHGMHIWCRINGIHIQYSNADRPAENGAAEKTNHVIFNQLRAILVIPRSQWHSGLMSLLPQST
jgi:hypothetical protein